ncbi:MAG: hypothetical protein EXX96DRAFT_623808 [Benjaminiella poitrasii]|nr:MAG: hypothetical protein EXX96DRAFT_623808 [Benjaminiella poitrasii]
MNKNSKEIIVIESDSSSDEVILSEQPVSPKHLYKRRRRQSSAAVVEKDSDDESRLLDELLAPTPTSTPSTAVDVNKLFQRVDKRRINILRRKKMRMATTVPKKSKYPDHKVGKKNNGLTAIDLPKLDMDDNLSTPSLFTQSTNQSQDQEEVEEIYTFDLDSLSSSSDEEHDQSLSDMDNIGHVSPPISSIRTSHVQRGKQPERSRRQMLSLQTASSALSSRHQQQSRESDDEEYDEAEADLEDYLNYIVNGRQPKRLFPAATTSRPNTTTTTTTTTTTKRVQCPLCYLFFTASDILVHAADCDGCQEGSSGTKKKTIATGVAQSERERKKLNQGIEYYGNANYYTDSDVVALDGSGFNSEVTSTSWESAGQIRFT